MSKTAFLPHIAQIPELCFRAGIRRCIISPGSRNAPLIAAFARHPAVQSYVVPDERSAAFIGLGMALKNSEPTALVCTSGTAVLNYFPAVAEAFYQEIPLLILTADRPPELLDRHEGQTIRQRNVYGEHVKASFEIPCDASYADAQAFSAHILNEALNRMLEEPKGPVHINIPLREPLYPAPEQGMLLPDDVRGLQSIPVSYGISETDLRRIADLWNAYDKKLLIPGQSVPDPKFEEMLGEICENQRVPVVADVTSNTLTVKDAVRNHDFFLGSLSEEEREALKPDLLITFGKAFLSKNLKNFLRRNRPKYHIHVSPGSKIADPTLSVTHKVALQPCEFLTHILKSKNFQKNPEIYFNTWSAQNEKIARRKRIYLEEAGNFSELKAAKIVLDHIPESTCLHLANSMPVRYANMLLEGTGDLKIYSNRGTCGIDGSVSAAVGAALASPKELHILLTGDMSFFYDRNALWHNYSLSNLRIIVLNNHGGDIFRMIDGPAALPEAEEYLITRQLLNAKNTAADAGAEYYFCETISALNAHLRTYFEASDTLKILEIKTDGRTNAKTFRKLKEFIKEKKV